MQNKNSFLELKYFNNFGKICGYASVFNIEDSYNDIILPSAFKNTLLQDGDIKMLWQHDITKPIGYFDVIREDDIGLYIEGQILLNTMEGKNAFELIKTKSVSGLSIGYFAIDFSYTKDNKRVLKEIELKEISIVTFPANKHSKITYFKNDHIMEKLDRIERIFTPQPSQQFF
ncbi:MAG: HK97 family phage prohead protease [Rickettsiales bacterium]|jgi:HK97 family phage prohead protease|nr:HK97 family phage prohead protease [Rickettsiales bacterium]